MEETVERIAAGYDTVYTAIPNSPTFARIWRDHAIGADFPDGFEHISFLTLNEMRTMGEALALTPGATLLDLACGMGGPGLWIARDQQAHLVGIDASNVAIEHAVARANRVGMSDHATFTRGTFAETGLDAASCDAAMSCDALQYAPDKRRAFAEAARVLKPGARFVFVCFELDPAELSGVPILGDDPVPDYRALLEETGFEVNLYDETPAWHERVTDTYEALVAAKAALITELGEPAANALLGEVTLTLQLHPYRRRVFAIATRR